MADPERRKSSYASGSPLEKRYIPSELAIAEIAEVIGNSDYSISSLLAQAEQIGQLEANPAISLWQEGKIADEVLCGVLGHPYWSREFDYYFPPARLPWGRRFSRALEREDVRNRFENTMTAILIWSILNRIEQNTSIDDLAASITALYLVSNNQRESQSRYNLLNRRRGAAIVADVERFDLDDLDHAKSMFSYFFPQIDYIEAYCQEREKLDEDPRETDERIETVVDLFSHHFEAYDLNHEHGCPVNPQLMGAFFGILKDNHQAFLAPREGYQGDTVVLDKFARKYFEGLLEVAQAVMDHRHNKILYLSDHLERVLQKAEKWPKPGEVWSEQKWREELLSAVDNEDLFNFLAPEEKVREIVGRYDYRALIDYLRTLKGQGLSAFQILACGFGYLGVASYELAQRITSEIGIDPQIIPADIMALGPISDPAKVEVTQYCRTPEGVVDRQYLPDRRGVKRPFALTRNWEAAEKEEVLAWRDGVLPQARQADLTVSAPLATSEQVDLVTLQGTISCIGDLRDRTRAIANSLASVREGGMVLIEGSISGLSQNVYSIALRRTSDHFEVVYLGLAGDYQGQNETCLNYSLLENTDVIPDISHGANYASVPFSDKQLLLQTIYDLVGRRIQSIYT
ncbi:hypothetical protein FJY90_06910 [Candidatus Gottesmanbacteria bacterium]|nr:hypothetical protein [Candidatus Gottesmanbacteria bacterium]